MHDHVLKLCERQDIAQCPPLWQQMHTVAKGGQLALLLQELSRNGANHDMVGPDFAADLCLVRWIPSDPTKLTEGLTFTRLYSFLTPAADQARRDAANRTYQLLSTVDAPTTGMTELVIAETKANIPTSASKLRAQVRSMYILLTTLAGVGTQHTRAFHDHLYARMDEIEMLIIRDYSAQEKLVCLIITLWIVRTMRQALIELADGAVPTAATPQPVTHAPPYGDIYMAVAQGNILKLQDVPSSLIEERRPAPRPASAPAPAPTPARGQSAPAQPTGATGSTSSSQRAPVRHPNQNPRLKQAWMRGGEPSRSVYQRAGDPYYDSNLPPPHKVQVMRQAGNTQQRICLPMAVKGVCTSTCTGWHGELSASEEAAVAAAATPPLHLE